MNPYVSVIPLGVSDLNRVKQMYSEGLSFEVRNDVAFGMRCIMVGPANQPGTSIPGLPDRLQARQDTPGRCDP